MKKFIIEAKNRIKNSKGMSLGEVLVAVLIMLLATSALVTAVDLGVRHYLETLSASEANTLNSTLQSIITNELEYTTDIRVKDTSTESAVVSFQSQNYVVSGSLSTLFSSKGEGNYGEVLIGSSSDYKKLLGDGSYPNNLGVLIKKFTYNSSTYTFTVEISISNSNKEFLDKTFQVINVNKTKPVTG